jgi:hypothetical protein
LEHCSARREIAMVSEHLISSRWPKRGGRNKVVE